MRRLDRQIRMAVFAMIAVFAVKVTLDTLTPDRWLINLPATSFMLFMLEYNRQYTAQKPVCRQTPRCIPCVMLTVAYMDHHVIRLVARAIWPWSESREQRRARRNMIRSWWKWQERDES